MACKEFYQTAGCLLLQHQSLDQWCYTVEVPQPLQIDFVSLHPQFIFALKLQQHSNEKILNPSIMLLKMANGVQLGWDLIVRKTTAYVYNIIFFWVTPGGDPLILSGFPILFYCPYCLVLCFTLCCACLSSKSCRREMFHMVKDKLGTALPLQRQADPNIASGMPPTT